MTSGQFSDDAMQDLGVNLKVLPQVVEVKLLATGHEIRVVVPTSLPVGMCCPAFPLHFLVNVSQLHPAVVADVSRIDSSELCCDAVVILKKEG